MVEPTIFLWRGHMFTLYVHIYYHNKFIYKEIGQVACLF